MLNAGLAGIDHVWTENVHAAGGWDLIDGFAFHPGRGNFTPDYAPPPEEWTQGDNGSYGNFLGGLRKAREMIAEYGHKELWPTEAYACTKPNIWWHDTYRRAAENVLLTLALAKAEGVRCVNWYQLHDSVLGKPQMADPADPDLKGLLFSTPEGPVSILWSRKDGYLLDTDHAPGSTWFAAPEPWVDGWPTKTELKLAAAGSSVRELDRLGVERRLTARDGKVKVRLDGAPRVYYGLTAAPDRPP
ncbi:hypothetical protein [Nonomuraea sp. NPDC050643]|uniref:hypothetical protein n=1 Tax=Nonomuraea sp. NPDC050643 TaxID=3155660 RepID=UPI0033CD0A0E